MKKKANIYDADDVERSKRLNFTPEERAARAEHKAEVLGTKLEKAKKKVPKKKKLRLQKELDPEKSKLKHTLRFEEVEKKRGQESFRFPAYPDEPVGFLRKPVTSAQRSPCPQRRGCLFIFLKYGHRFLPVPIRYVHPARNRLLSFPLCVTGLIEQSAMHGVGGIKRIL